MHLVSIPVCSGLCPTCRGILPLYQSLHLHSYLCFYSLGGYSTRLPGECCWIPLFVLSLSSSLSPLPSVSRIRWRERWHPCCLWHVRRRFHSNPPFFPLVIPPIAISVLPILPSNHFILPERRLPASDLLISSSSFSSLGPFSVLLDGNGELDPEEFQQGLKMLNIHLSERKFKHLIRLIDRYNRMTPVTVASI